jgi:hypothetical protein
MRAIFSIHCFFAMQKSKGMVRNGGEFGVGVGRFEDVRCQVSGVRCHKGNHALNSTRNTVLATPHVSKLKLLLLCKVILQKFKFKVLASALRD